MKSIRSQDYPRVNQRTLSLWRAKPALLITLMLALCLGTALILGSCTSIAIYSETAYEQAVSLKVESLALMDKATEACADHKIEIEALKTKLQTAYEFAKGRPKNEISAKQWQIMIDPDRNMIGGFLKRWEENAALTQTFIDEAKGLISDGFDAIIGLESGKIKPNELQGK